MVETADWPPVRERWCGALGAGERFFGWMTLDPGSILRRLAAFRFGAGSGCGRPSEKQGQLTLTCQRLVSPCVDTQC